eukprot:s4263_g9.t2
MRRVHRAVWRQLAFLALLAAAKKGRSLSFLVGFGSFGRSQVLSSTVQRRAMDDFADDFVYREEVSKLRALRAAQRAKLSASSWDADLAWISQLLPWVALFFLCWFLYYIANPTNDIVPEGRMPTLDEWLQKKAPNLAGSWGGRAPPPREDILQARNKVVAEAQCPGNHCKRQLWFLRADLADLADPADLALARDKEIYCCSALAHANCMAAVVPADVSSVHVETDSGPCPCCSLPLRLRALLASNGTWTSFRTLAFWGIVNHALTLAVAALEFDSVWLGLVVATMGGKLTLALWMLVIVGRRPLADLAMEAERCKQLREMHALMAFACFLNGLTLICMAILQLTEPELLNLGLILRRIFQPLLLIVLEALIATCAFHGRRCAAERLRLVQRWEFTHIQSVHQINTASVAMEKKFTADVEWYFLMHMTTSKFEQGQLKPLTPALRDSAAPGAVPQEETDKPEPAKIAAAEGHEQEAPAPQQRAETLTCSICLEGFEEGDEVSQPRCVHFFHRSCLENWVQALSKEHVTSAKRKREQAPTTTVALMVGDQKQQLTAKTRLVL